MFLNPFTSIWKNRSTIVKFFVADMKHTHAGSVMGVFWMFFLPIVFLLSYAFIYAVIFKVKPDDMSTADYVIHVCAGIMAFLSFATALTSGSGSLVQQKDLLLCTTFPIELIPLRSVLTSFMTIVVGFTCLSVYVIITRGFLYSLILGPVLTLLFFMWVLGVVWMLAVVYIFFKDLHQILVFLNMFLLIVSPISYTQSMMTMKLQLAMYINPLTYYILPMQQIFRGEFPSVVLFTMTSLISLISFIGGYLVFFKTKYVVMDYV